MGLYYGQSGAGIHIRMAAKAKKITLEELGRRHGDIAKNVFYNKMSRDTMGFREVEEIADLLDCDVVFLDRKTKKLY